jgi:transcriptional regulator with XRE-family HTH domain
VDPRSPAHRDFGLAIRQLRQERGLSQEALAHASDLDRGYMGGVERGERNVSLANILKLCHALAVRPSELFARFESLTQ